MGVGTTASAGPMRALTMFYPVTGCVAGQQQPATPLRLFNNGHGRVKALDIYGK